MRVAVIFRPFGDFWNDGPLQASLSSPGYYITGTRLRPQGNLVGQAYDLSHIFVLDQTTEFTEPVRTTALGLHFNLKGSTS
jgi:hypothetical protein